MILPLSWAPRGGGGGGRLGRGWWVGWGGGEGVVGCWKIGLLVNSILFQTQYGCAGKEGCGSCVHHSLSILRLSSAAIGNIAKIFHAFLFNITLSRGERLSKNHCV